MVGPEFFNTKVEIDGQLWAGHVEMHPKSSHWYAHHNQADENYDNVILHLVWEGDIAVFRNDGPQLPTLEVKNFVSSHLLNGCQDLMNKSRTSFISCELE